MSHRLALTLSLLLTIPFALLVVVERNHLIGPSVASDPGGLADPQPADPAVSDAQPMPIGAAADASRPRDRDGRRSDAHADEHEGEHGDD